MTMLRSLVLVALILALALPAGGSAPSHAGFDAQAPTADDPGAPLRARFLADQEPVRAMEPLAFTPCVGGMAGS